MKGNSTMKIVVISGSSRIEAQSLRVSKFLRNKLQARDIETEIVDLNSLRIPIVPDWELESSDKALSEETKHVLAGADGFVCVTPEWSGMAAPAYKNFMLHVGDSMTHKPALLVGVSDSRGGAYPIAELRMSSYKNTRINYIPEHLIFRNVKEMNLSDTPANEDEEYIIDRTYYALHVLLDYASALKVMRQNTTLNYKDFPYGM